jgi:hypothetical protein
MLEFFIYNVVAVKKSRRCCQCDIMAKRGNIFEVGGSGTDGETITKWNMNCERHRFNVLVHKQCCNVANCGKMLYVHNAKHAYGRHTIKVCTCPVVIVHTGVSLVAQACEHNKLERVCCNDAG